MPRAGLTQARVVELALEIAQTGEPVTLGAVAARAGVRTPSLYKHVGSAAELDSLVAEHVLRRLHEHVDTAIGERTGVAAGAASLEAYRHFARAHPTLYAVLPVQPGLDPRLRPLGDALMDRIARALGYPGLDDPGSLHALRLVRAAAEGFLQLELAGGFGQPVDVEASWRHLVRIVSEAAAAGERRPQV